MTFLNIIILDKETKYIDMFYFFILVKHLHTENRPLLSSYWFSELYFLWLAVKPSVMSYSAI